MLPVVAMTASGDPDAIMRAGCIGYIPKPFEPHEFTALTGEFLQVTAGRFAGGRPPSP